VDLNGNAAIRVRNLRKAYGGHDAVHGGGDRCRLRVPLGAAGGPGSRSDASPELGVVGLVLDPHR
jgi:hypothetical protein